MSNCLDFKKISFWNFVQVIPVYPPESWLRMDRVFGLNLVVGDRKGFITHLTSVIEILQEVFGGNGGRPLLLKT